ncbi:DUF3858 domain-containing protein [Parasediminibacterium paludis]|uniref:DUF3858 domain-containing protein n=1 Tax=Parasediminibacterium paludis TaxID=908966 RepID=A0ABV8PYZ4_9BACT
MKTQVSLLFTVILLTLSFQIFAQSNAMYQLEKVKLADFNPQSPVVDSNSNAVILAEIGSSEFVSNATTWYTLVYKYTKRVLIKNRKAFDEATVKIPIYIGDNRSNIEKMEDFEATTYNVKNNDTIEETKLDKNEIFKVESSKSRILKKFTFPNLKEGSIIEYKFTIKSALFILIRPWRFQSAYPTLINQYHVIIPPMFNYYTLRQGYLPYSLDSSKALFNAYSTLISNTANRDSYNYSIAGNARFTLWSLKDVPAFKSESFTANLSTLLPQIYFQLNSINYSDSKSPYAVLRTWKSMSKYIQEDEDYYSALKEKKNWLDNDCKIISVGANKFEKAKSIYNYVRDHYKCIDYDASVWLSEPIKKIFQAKSGSVTDINLMLMAMLTHEGFDVHPVILSTKDNGYVTEQAPVLQQYNYVIARVKIDTSYVLLDASVPKLGFGKLTGNCYNRSARVLDDSATLISMVNDDILETKSTVVFISNDEKGGSISGSYNSTLGDAESFQLRDTYKEKVVEDYTKDLVKTYPSEIEVSNLQIDSLKICEAPITLHYDIKINTNDADLLYLNPMFANGMLTNPFTAADRFFPIEMPHKINEVYTLNLEVPKGYVIDEIPKSTRIKLDSTNSGIFEYITVLSDNTIQLRSKLQLNKAMFAAEDYQNLRNFFALVVKKHAEQIVFKKIKQ